MYSNVAFDNSIRVVQRLRLSSSFCIVGQNDPIIASSNAWPTEPNEGMRPAARTFSVKAQNVN